MLIEIIFFAIEIFSLPRICIMKNIQNLDILAQKELIRDI